MDAKLKMLIESCVKVFELVEKTVPSNHAFKITEEVNKLKKILEVKDEPIRSGKQERTGQVC